ncbi:helix-turn-helix transcriptional regulator [Sphingomonas paucimobilis]|uniref:helix-turn-helix transcriptional regulator n=1 Tax=Sphingomonas paucimobilis TaxID=13689 RepID=UPI0031D0FE73
MGYKITDPAEMLVQDTAGVIHPGSMITGEIEAAGMSIEEAADFADLTRDTLTQVVSGNAPVTPEIAGQLSLLFGAEFAELLLRWQNRHVTME